MTERGGPHKLRGFLVVFAMLSIQVLETRVLTDLMRRRRAGQPAPVIIPRLSMMLRFDSATFVANISMMLRFDSATFVANVRGVLLLLCGAPLCVV